MTVTDREIVQKMRDHPDPAFTPQELAKMLDLKPETVRKRCEDLADENKIHRKKPSTRTLIYWANQDHREPESELSA